MDARWIAGVWMGRRPEAGDHLVAIGDGRILCGRSCRALIPNEVTQSDYTQVLKILKLWAKPATADDVIVFSGGAAVEVPRPRVAHARPVHEPEEEGERPTTQPRWSPTSGCPACSDIPSGQHTLRCRKRKANMELAEERKAFKAHMEQDISSEQEKEMVTPDEEIEGEATRAVKRCGSEEEPGQIKRRRSARLAEKRRRAEEAQEEQEAEEQMVRGTIDFIVKEKFEGRAA